MVWVGLSHISDGWCWLLAASCVPSHFLYMVMKYSKNVSPNSQAFNKHLHISRLLISQRTKQITCSSTASRCKENVQELGSEASVTGAVSVKINHRKHEGARWLYSFLSSDSSSSSFPSQCARLCYDSPKSSDEGPAVLEQLKLLPALFT